MRRLRKGLKQRPAAPRKRDTDQASTLALVVQGIESESGRRQRSALLTLLLGGPMFVDHDAYKAIDTWPDDTLERAELMQFLRTILRLRGSGLPASMSTLDRVTVTAYGQGARVGCFLAGDPRDLLLLQLAGLLQAVGLQRIHRCPAAGCSRMFVKVYRRRFCSTPCQKRTEKRVNRAAQREEDAKVRRVRHRVRKER